MTLARKTPMSRGSGPGLRRTPLNPGTKGLETRTPLARGKPMESRAKPLPTRAPADGPARPAKPRTRARHTGQTTEVRALVNARDGGLCVRCGAPASNQDHRRNRGSGGTKGEASARINTAAALITLCGMGNTSGCHKWKDDDPDEALRTGYRLPLNGVQRDPARVPVLTRKGWRLPTIAGKWERCPAPLDDDARNAA